MRHFFVWPSAREDYARACATKWRAKGYLTCVGLDGPPREPKDSGFYDILHFFDSWRGYYQEIHALVREAFVRGNADLVTVGGDDQDPDPKYTAEQVAEIYFSRFGSLPSIDGGLEGYGVMQATGDKQGDLMLVPGYEQLGPLRNAGRICGSPTFGRGWYNRGYREPGGFPRCYSSFYGDEDCWNMAMKRGLLWLNPEITIHHRHWSWGHMPKQDYHDAAQKSWDADKETFMNRKGAGFPL